MKIGRLELLPLALAVVVTWLPAQAQEDVRAEIQQMIEQVAEMKHLETRMAELERKLEDSEKEQEILKKAQEASTPTVTTGTRGSKIRMDARTFMGIFDSGADGTYENWSTDIRDAKIRFTFSPSDKVTVVNRFNASGAKTADFDYFYLDYKDAIGPGSIIRLGQRKLDVGQETWVDNPVENMLITIAASGVSGYATGIAALGRLGNGLLYEAGFANAQRGVMRRPTSGLPVNVKLGMPLPGNLFASTSYFTTGKLGQDDRSAITVAGLTSAPSGATEWRRNLWEIDLRYNYGDRGIRALVPTGNLPPVMIGATYGSFSDSAVGASDRDGDFWFVEGLATINSRTYAAARYSVVNLDNGVLAKLAGSPESVNSYRRTSLGLGYALTDLTHIKTEYTINNTRGGPTDPSLNQWAVGIASKF